MPSNITKTGDPQVGQKKWNFPLPLSPATRQELALPVMVTDERFGNVKKDAWPVPLLFWQSRHWQWF